MAESGTFNFNDPDAYLAALRAMRVSSYVPARSGAFKARLAHLNLDRLWLQSGSETVARSVHVALDPDRRPISFLADEAAPTILESGTEVTADTLVFYSPGATQYQRSAGPSNWASMSLTADDLDDASRLIYDRPVNIPSEARYLRPGVESLQRLRSLHRTAMSLASSSPHMFDNHEVVKSLEHDLTLTMVACIAEGDDRRFNRAWYRHRQIMRRFAQWLEMNGDQPAHLLKVCADLGVPVRTLTLCCQEYLGMSPIRYLWLRRMTLARTALLRADSSTTITAVALNFGFLQLGRFAVSYRSLFGESPSATLARSALAKSALSKSAGHQVAPSKRTRVCQN
jgi:AraC-like DNA-binding protein